MAQPRIDRCPSGNNKGTTAGPYCSRANETPTGADLTPPQTLAIVSIQDLYNTISCTFCSPDEIKAQCQG